MLDRVKKLLLKTSKGFGIIGASVFFVIALLWVIFGFFRMLFILLVTCVGYYFGVRIFENPEKIKNYIDKIFPSGKFR